METKRDYYGEMKETYENAIKDQSGEGKKIVFSVCPETYKKPCKLCEACKNILWHKDANTAEMVQKAGELNRKEKFYANVILASNPAEVVVFEYGPTIGNKLVSYEMGVDSDYKGFSDPNKGRNIVIVKYPNPDPKKTKYDVEARVNAGPLPDMGALQRMYNLDTIMEDVRIGKIKTLYQSKLPAGKTEMRFLPSWLGPQFASIFQLKYKLHYHTSEEELAAIQRGEMNPLEDIIIVKPEPVIAPASAGSPWGQGSFGNQQYRPPMADWAIAAPITPPAPEQIWGTPPTAPAQAGRIACFGTYDEAEPECTMTCAGSLKKDNATGLTEFEACKKEMEAKKAQRKAAKGLYR